MADEEVAVVVEAVVVLISKIKATDKSPKTIRHLADLELEYKEQQVDLGGEVKAEEEAALDVSLPLQLNSLKHHNSSFQTLSRSPTLISNSLPVGQAHLADLELESTLTLVIKDKPTSLDANDPKLNARSPNNLKAHSVLVLAEESDKLWARVVLVNSSV